MANCSQTNNTTIIETSAVSYDSTPLPCTDVKACDDLNTILTKFDNVICSAVNSVNILTEEVMNITEDLMIIGEEIENINNQIFICCRICDFTGTANELPIPTTTTTSSSTTSTTTTATPTTSTTSSSTSSTTSTTSTSTSTSTSTTTSTSSSTTTTTTTVFAYCPTSVISPTTPYYWKGLTTTPDGTIYGCTLDGFVRKYPVGGPWSSVTVPDTLNAAIAADSLGNVYAAKFNGNIFVKSFSASFFIGISPTPGYLSWTGLFVDQFDTLWAIDTSGNIYTKASFTNIFAYHGPSIAAARDITVAPNGDIYVCRADTMLKQTGGVGAFVPLPTSPGYWTSVSAAPNGDIICVGEAGFPPYVGGIWVIYAGTNTFVKLSCDSDSDWESVHAIASGKFYAGQSNGPEGDGQVHIFG